MKKKGGLVVLFFVLIVCVSFFISAKGSCENNSCKIYLGEDPITYQGNSFKLFAINNIENGLQVNGIQSRVPGPGESREIGNLNVTIKELGVDFIGFSFTSNAIITEEGSYVVKKGYAIELNDISATIREIPWALSGVTEPRVLIDNGPQECSLYVGESCKLFYGAVNQPTSDNLMITVVSIQKNEEVPDESTAYIAIKKIKEDIVPEKKPEVIPPATSEGAYFCQGCQLDNNCYPFGYRKSGNYCSEERRFVSQIETGLCQNSFECSSNVCANGSCITQNFLQKVLDFFKRLFGGE